MNRFLSGDKMTITLPVPLGSVVYTPVISCSNICTADREKFDKLFPRAEGGRCGKGAPCAGSLYGVDSVEFTSAMLNAILSGWGTRYFETAEGATKYAEAKIAKDVAKRAELGLADIKSCGRMI